MSERIYFLTTSSIAVLSSVVYASDHRRFASFFLRKGKGAGSSQQIDLTRSCCPNLRQPFSYANAAKEAPNAPCINVLIICPLCPDASSAVWKYNLASHFERHHPMNRGFFEEFLASHLISNSDRKGMETIWNKHHTKR
jgi:hypothetical protein